MPCLLSDNGLPVCAMCEQVDRYKVLQIGYDPEHDRLTWDGWEIHCGQSLEVLLPDRLGGGTWRHVSFEMPYGICPTNLGSHRSAYGHGRP